MAKKSSSKLGTKTVESLKHADKRKNIPTAEFQSVLQADDQKPIELRYPRNKDLDPQLMWRGKDEQDWSDLVVHAPPIYIQEKVHPKVLIDDLLTRSKATKAQAEGFQPDLFADFNGLPIGADKTDFEAGIRCFQCLDGLDVGGKRRRRCVQHHKVVVTRLRGDLGELDPMRRRIDQLAAFDQSGRLSEPGRIPE